MLKGCWLYDLTLKSRAKPLDQSMSGRGRGAYFKQKYGGRGRGRGRGTDQAESNEFGMRQEPQGQTGQTEESGMTAQVAGRRLSGTFRELASILKRIDGKGYKAYNDIRGRWNNPDKNFILCVEHVQADPYASPSHLSVEVPPSVAQIPPEMWQNKIRRIALCDYLARSLHAAVQSAGADVRAHSNGWGGEKGGEMTVDAGNQHVLERTAVILDSKGGLEARFTVALPARGRSVLGDWAQEILIHNLPKYVEKGLCYKQQDVGALQHHIEVVEDTQFLRQQLPGLGLVAFVGNGAILPRTSGVSDKPLNKSQAVPFQSPPSMEVEIELPNHGKVKGMGIASGVTLIVGGGFHGKSTLLKALEAGVTNKVPGDGREFVVTDARACKIRAEDGRRVECVDISPFISNLPYGKDTKSFQTEDASGSTSQAANIMEALEVGASLMLIDEDTTATNFMIRDERMQALIATEKEPITPLVAKIRGLANNGISCILVIGGSGDYFEVADHVIAMDCFKTLDLSSRAHEVAQQFGRNYDRESRTAFGKCSPRMIKSIHAGVSRDLKCKTRDVETLVLGYEDVDLSAVDQLFDVSQTRAIGAALLLLMDWIAKPHWSGRTLAATLDALEQEIESKGLDILSHFRKSGSLARPRRFEIAAAINRLRTAKLGQWK